MAAKLAMIGGSEMFSMKLEEIGDLTVGCWDETLALSRRFEPHHALFSSSHRKVRVLRAIVQAFVRTMLDAGDQLSFRGRVRAQLVGDHHTRRDALGSQQLSHQPESDLPVSEALQ